MMSDALALNLNIFLRSVIKSIGVFVFMLELSWRLTMITLIGLPIIIGVSKVYGVYYEALSKKVCGVENLSDIISEIYSIQKPN